MRSHPNAVAACCLAVALAVSSASAESESNGPDETERWVPSFSLSFDVFAQNGSGATRSGEVMGPPLDPDVPLSNQGCINTDSGQLYGDRYLPNGQPGSDGRADLCPLGQPPPPQFLGTRSVKALAPYQLMPDDDDTDSNVLPMVLGAFELMTPRLLDGLAQPRLFAHVDLAWAFGFERRMAGVRAPEAFAPPPLIPGSVGNIQEDSVIGQGSRANLQTGEFVLSAGAGVAFAARALGRSLRIKPSFEYIRQPVELRGILNRAVKLQDAAVPGVLRPEDFRLIELRAKDSVILHGFGGGLELEADTRRLGPLMLSVFLQGRAYYFPDTLDETLTASNAFGETATWGFELEPWAWRAGAGLRFRWLPERTLE